MFFFRTTGPTSTKLCIKHFWVKEFKFIQMNDPALFQGEINYKKARIHLRNLKISRNTGPISTKLAKCILGRKGFKFRNMKGHVFFHRKMFTWAMWPMGFLLILVSQLLQTLGRVGRVLKVYAMGVHTWTFNPACCSIVPSIEPDINNTNEGRSAGSFQ